MIRTSPAGGIEESSRLWSGREASWIRERRASVAWASAKRTSSLVEAISWGVQRQDLTSLHRSLCSKGRRRVLLTTSEGGSPCGNELESFVQWLEDRRRRENETRDGITFKRSNQQGGALASIQSAADTPNRQGRLSHTNNREASSVPDINGVWATLVLDKDD